MPEVDPTLEDDVQVLGVAKEAAETPSEETPEKTPAPEAKAPSEEKAHEKAELPEWSKPLTRLQQENAALKKQVGELTAGRQKDSEKLDKLLAHVGIEPDATPAQQEQQKAALDPEVQQTITVLQQKIEFQEIREDHPGSNPRKAWDEAWDKALATFDIDKDATELPAGISPEAVKRVAQKNFQAWRDDLGTEKTKLKTPATPPRPPSRIPPKTAGGNGPPTRPASHIPAPLATVDSAESMKEDCQLLVTEE